MVRFYDGRLGLLLERSDGDGAAPRLLGAGGVGAHFFCGVSGAAAGRGRLLMYRQVCRGCTGGSNAPSVG